MEKLNFKQYVVFHYAAINRKNIIGGILKSYDGFFPVHDFDTVGEAVQCMKDGEVSAFLFVNCKNQLYLWEKIMCIGVMGEAHAVTDDKEILKYYSDITANKAIGFQCAKCQKMELQEAREVDLDNRQWRAFRNDEPIPEQ